MAFVEPLKAGCLTKVAAGGVVPGGVVPGGVVPAAAAASSAIL